MSGNFLARRAIWYHEGPKKYGTRTPGAVHVTVD